MALNAANAGTTALENASESTLGVIADLETMIIFASAGTLENDSEGETFAGLQYIIINFWGISRSNQNYRMLAI